MNNTGKKRKNSLIGWIVAFLSLCLILFLFLFLKKDWKVGPLEWIGVYGSFFSFFGLIVMFFQFKSVRETTEETKDKLDHISVVSDWTKAIEMIRGVETDIEREYYTTACYKLKNVKDIVIRTKKNNADNDETEELEKAVKTLNSFISELNQFILSDDKVSINKNGILNGMEMVADIMNNRINNHKNSI